MAILSRETWENEDLQDVMVTQDNQVFPELPLVTVYLQLMPRHWGIFCSFCLQWSLKLVYTALCLRIDVQLFLNHHHYFIIENVNIVLKIQYYKCLFIVLFWSFKSVVKIVILYVSGTEGTSRKRRNICKCNVIVC